MLSKKFTESDQMQQAGMETGLSKRMQKVGIEIIRSDRYLETQPSLFDGLRDNHFFNLLASYDKSENSGITTFSDMLKTWDDKLQKPLVFSYIVYKGDKYKPPQTIEEQKAEEELIKDIIDVYTTDFARYERAYPVGWSVDYR